MKEESFGIIPCRRNQTIWEIFLIQHKKGHWGFPKGHSNTGEMPLDTAKRELFEETNLKVVRLLTQEAFQEHYTIDNSIDKTVTYFLAEVKGLPVIQNDEISDCAWFPPDEIEDQITFPECKKLWNEVRSRKLL